MPPTSLDTTPLSPQPPTPPGLNIKMLALALACGLVLIVIIVGLSLSLGHPSKPASSKSKPTPQASPSASPTPAPTPTPSDTAKAPAASPTYNNFDALTTQGFTSNQLEDLEYSLSKYSQSIGQPGADISLDPNSVNVVAPNPNSPTATVGLTYTFDLTIGNNSDHASISTPSDTGAATTLTNGSGAQIYSSGLVDLFNGIGDN